MTPHSGRCRFVEPQTLVALYTQSRSERRTASEILMIEDTTTAYVLNRAVWIYGSFVENEMARFQHASKETGTGKAKKHVHPTDDEVREYRRALIEQTGYNPRSRKKRKTMSLSEFARMNG